MAGESSESIWGQAFGQLMTAGVSVGSAWAASEIEQNNRQPVIAQTNGAQSPVIAAGQPAPVAVASGGGNPISATFAGMTAPVKTAVIGAGVLVVGLVLFKLLRK